MPGHMRAKAKRRKALRSEAPTRIVAIALVVVSVVAVGIMVAAGRPSQTAPSGPSKAAAPTTTVAKSAPAAKKESAAKSAVPVKSEPAKPLRSTAPVAASTTTAQEPTPVTVTGCLERSDRVFRLKDTEGINAPTARSWKSGFLKKRSADLTVIAANGVQLSNYAGQRVKLTGTLTDREMQARSLVSVSRSCS